MREVEKDIPNLEDPVSALKVLAALTRAAASTGDLAKARETLKRGFDFGEEMFQQDLDARPGNPAMLTSGFDDLAKLAEIGIQIAPNETIDRLSTIRNPILRAHLMIDVSLAIHNKSETPK